MDKPFVSLRDLARGFARAMNLISPEVQNHHQKVAYLACQIAAELDLPEQDRLTTLAGALLHDVGSVMIEGDVSLRELERGASALARSGAAILGLTPATRGFSGVVSYSQTPWRALSALPKLPLSPIRIGQIIHLSDTVSLMLNEDESVLNQAERVRRCVESAGDREYSPQVRRAFDAVSRRESVWMDMLYAPDRFLDFLPESRMVTLEKTLQYTEFLSRIIDFRSPFTAMHSAGVAATAEALARYAGMSEKECQMMRVAGYLHDVGKLKIPKSILEKPGKLTDEEFNVMKEHAYYTHLLLHDIRGFEQIAVWAAFHHEKLNGSGYPFHYAAEDIPLGARVMAVADVFSAITEDRPYRRGMDRERTLAVLREDVERSQLSESLVDLLVAHLDDINAARDKAAHIAGRRYYDALERDKDQ